MNETNPQPDLPMTELPDGSGCFTATILSEEEALALPQNKRPLNYRLSSEMYHEAFYAVGQASMCWNPPPDKDKMHNFQPEKLEQIAVKLCFKIADELDKWKSLGVVAVCADNPAVAEYIESLEKRLHQYESN